MAEVRRAFAYAVVIATVLTLGVGASAVWAEPTQVQELDQSHTDLEVFMEVHATSAQLSHVRHAVERDSAVLRFAYLDHAAALTEFRRLFRRNAEFRSKIRARDLPESFRLRVKRGERRAVAARIGRLNGVDAVVGLGGDPGRNAWTSWLRCSRTAYDLEVVMLPNATPLEIDAVASQARAAAGVEGVEVADVEEVAAIRRCIAPGDETDAGTLSVLVHVSVDDPGSPATDALSRQLRVMAGVDTVNRDPGLPTAA